MNGEEGGARTIPPIRAETEIIHRMIMNLEDPTRLDNPDERERLTYDGISKAIGFDIRKRSHLLRSAMNKALNDGIATMVKANVGVIRITAAEHADEMKRRRLRANNQNKRAQKIGGVVTRESWEAMSPGERNSLSLERTLAAMSISQNKSSSVRRLAAECEKAGTRLTAARGCLALMAREE